MTWQTIPRKAFHSICALSASIGLLLLLPFSARAQDKVEIFGGYSYLHYDGSPSGSLNGWELSGQYKFVSFLGGVVDVNAHYGSPSGVSEKPVNVLLGPQISLPARVSPFFHVMIGDTHLNGSNSFATSIGGGIDDHIVPFLSWRIFQFDDIVTKFFGHTQNNARVSTGIVFHF